MRVLLDECVPRGLRAELPGHEVKTVAEAGWAGVKNGALLQLAANHFDVLLTVDRNLEYQQSFSALTIAVIVIDVPSNGRRYHLEPSPRPTPGRLRQDDVHFCGKVISIICFTRPSCLPQSF